MAWKTVEIGSFLQERGDRFKPEEANTLDLKRIEKIDFQGKIHVIDHKPTKTNMILVKKGDLVISGINVEKGALAVYEEDEDALATIHYSSYEYDKNQVDIEYLKWFLKSRTFQNIVKEQVGGGIKTELKPKKFLPLKIKMPGLDEQIDIARKIDNVTAEIDDLSKTNNHNQTLLIQLRQAILQEAVQGKLIPQDPNDEPAIELLKRIKAEKEKLITEGKIRKQKPLPSITEDEIPYELPEGWEWVRLGEIGKTQTGSTPPTSKREYYGNDYAFIKPADISGQGIRYNNGEGLSKKGIEKGRFIKAYSVLMVCIGGSIGKVNFVDRDCSCNQQINAVTPYNDVDFCLVNYNLASPYFQNQVLTNAPSTTLPILSKGKWENIPFPLPPLAEQKRIVAKIDQLMHFCDELETRLNRSKKDSEMLMQAVLYEAFS